MAAKSPTGSVKSREIIGVDQFSQRREVFDKNDTVFIPLPSPTTSIPPYKEAEPIITSNHGKTTLNFKRNTPGYSSMRETRSEDRNHFEFRPRKYSDNFTSELNQSDDVDYRHTMTERTRRLSKLRREFLNSNLHEPSVSPQFSRAGVRASMPTKSASAVKYKIESPNLYKFPFAEPYSTPTPVRRVVLDMGSSEIDGKENEDPEQIKPRHKSLPDREMSPKIDPQKLFEELVKRYSPQRKPIDWTLPPTGPRVVASVPKSISSGTESIGSENKKVLDEKNYSAETDDVFDNNNKDLKRIEGTKEPNSAQENVETIKNGPTKLIEANNLSNDSKKQDVENTGNVSNNSLTELEEKNDKVFELPTPRYDISKENNQRQPLETITDLSIPALIEKITVEGDNVENGKTKTKKVKRKRSFLDKLLGRNKAK